MPSGSAERHGGIDGRRERERLQLFERDLSKEIRNAPFRFFHQMNLERLQMFAMNERYFVQTAFIDFARERQGDAKVFQSRTFAQKIAEQSDIV